MPIVGSTNVITNSTQVGTGVINSTGILDGTILDADINAAAAIAATKIQTLLVSTNGGVIPSTGIVDAHIASGAAIADSKLAQITTASKVSGTAITGLASLPAGAGIIPAANLPSSGGKIVIAQYDVSTASGNQTIAHGLGTTPTKIEMEAILYYGVTGTMSYSHGNWDGSNYVCIYTGDGATAQELNATTFLCKLWFTGGNFFVSCTVTVDGTNITLAWTKNGSPTGNAQLILKAS